MKKFLYIMLFGVLLSGIPNIAHAGSGYVFAPPMGYGYGYGSHQMNMNRPFGGYYNRNFNSRAPQIPNYNSQYNRTPQTISCLGSSPYATIGNTVMKCNNLVQPARVIKHSNKKKITSNNKINKG